MRIVWPIAMSGVAVAFVARAKRSCKTVGPMHRDAVRIANVGIA